MKDQILIIENSLRTNIAMTRAMVSLMHFTLARRYLLSANKDKVMLSKLRQDWLDNSTLEYKTV